MVEQLCPLMVLICHSMPWRFVPAFTTDALRIALVVSQLLPLSILGDIVALILSYI